MISATSGFFFRNKLTIPFMKIHEFSHFIENYVLKSKYNGIKLNKFHNFVLTSGLKVSLFTLCCACFRHFHILGLQI